jgi:hypothetical protein
MLFLKRPKVSGFCVRLPAAAIFLIVFLHAGKISCHIHRCFAAALWRAKKQVVLKLKATNLKNAAISASRRNFAYVYYAYQCFFI